MSRPKIVVTVGPRSNDAASIRELRDAGMDLARLNGAHADIEWLSAATDVLRSVAPEVPIILDVPGRKVRTGKLPQEVRFDAGDVVVFTASEDFSDGEKIPVNGATLHKHLVCGDVIRAQDGELSFQVMKVVGADVVCRADDSGAIGAHKGISLPPSAAAGRLTSADRDIISFANEEHIDFIALSFVGSAAHVESARTLIGEDGPRIVAKIESQDALDHLEEIVDAADALMIDRGDLSVQTSLDRLVTSQKEILKVARRAARPVIVATELLHTMITNPYPTKAEVCDIGNAVLDGASAIMLSGETAIGKHPSRAVAFMKRIASSAAAYEQDGLDRQTSNGQRNIPSAVAEALSLMCRELPVTKIVAVTIKGYAARMVAATRPRQPILAVSNDAAAARSFNLLPGTEGVYVRTPFSRTSTDHIPICLEILWRQGKLVDDDLVLVTSLGYPFSGNRMNMIQTHSVADLCQVFGWKERQSEKQAFAGPHASLIRSQSAAAEGMVRAASRSGVRPTDAERTEERP